MHRLDPTEGVRLAGPLGLRFGFLAALVVLAVAMWGCRPAKKLDSTPAAAAETVRIGIVADPALAESIGRLKAEWHAVTGNTLEVVEVEKPDARAENLDAWLDGTAREPKADALVIPAAELGTLVEAGRLADVPLEVRESSPAAWPDMFLLVQQGAVWGEHVWAVPLGAPELTLLYRRDLFDRLNRSPPTTWAEYQTLAQFFGRRENLGDSAPPADAAWHGTLEPLADGWGARLLLARAAAYAKHRDNFSTLFNIETFKPLVAGPPFVRALEELVAANRAAPPAKPTEQPRADSIEPDKTGPDKTQPDATPLDSAQLDSAQLDVAGVRAAFFAGQSAMALTWPTAAGRSRVDVKVGFAELPGGTQMFNFASGHWDERTDDESVHVPTVPLEGRLGVVVKSSPHATAAFGLLTWLAGEKWGTRVASVSAATTLYRRSQQKEAPEWVEPGVDLAAAREYARVAGEAASRSVWVDALRIPGWEEYDAALDQAVGRAVRGEASAAAALETAAERFESISQRLGVERQRAAYRRNLGLEP